MFTKHGVIAIKCTVNLPLIEKITKLLQRSRGGIEAVRIFIVILSLSSAFQKSTWMKFQLGAAFVLYHGDITQIYPNYVFHLWSNCNKMSNQPAPN